MIKLIINSLLFLVLSSGFQSKSNIENSKKEQNPTELTIGTKYYIKSKILNEDRPVVIALPKDYATSGAHYPVLYLTDGLQNIWHVMGTTEVLARTGSIPPLIIVGIESTNRLRDFTFSISKNNPGSGGGKKFLEFIEKELIPYVNTNYRSASFKVLEGHSLGGLFAATTLIEKPDLFDAFIIMSPAMWWNGEELTQKAKSFFKQNHDLNKALFFGIGTYESGTDYGMRKELKNFVNVISDNKPDELRFEHKEIEKEGHMSSTLLSNYYGLKYVFSDITFPDDIYENYSDKKFLNHENFIMYKYGKSAKQAAEAYVGLALSLREKEKYQEAITVLERSVEAYPFDVGLMNLLANTLELNKKIEEAILVYKQAIETSKKYNYKREKEFENQIKRLTKK